MQQLSLPEIDPRAALRAALVSWLALRDYVTFGLMAGATEDAPIEPVDIAQYSEHVQQMNSLRSTIQHFAGLAVDKKQDPAEVIRAVVGEILSTQRPRFVLSSSMHPGSF